MKLLIITNNPANASFRQRVELHVPVLQDSGFDCTVAPLPSGSGGRRSLFRRAADCDGVLLHKKALNLHDAFFLRRHSRKIVYDFDDAVMYKAQTPNSRGGSRLRAFRRTVRLADLVIAGNQYLAEHARRYHASVEILPTGLDVSAYNIGARPKPDDRVRLVWIGGGATLRYLRDIGPALEDLGSRFPHVVLRIICDTFFDLKNLPVEKYRWSQQTQVSDLVSSDIALAPLPDDRFTRGKCGFKILQYAAVGLPVVASPVGVSAKYVQDGVTGFHAGGMSAWVDGIGRLVQDVKLRRAMGRAAERWVRQFDANSIGIRLVQILQRHLGEGQTYARAR